MSLSVKRFPRTQAKSYEDIRDDLENGDVLLCSGSGIFSAMIQQATGSIWSHVGFILRLDSIGRVMLLESVEPIGVRTVRLSKYLVNYKDNKPYPGGLAVIRHSKLASTVNELKLKKLVQFAVDRFGYPYDKDEIAKIAARILQSKIPFTSKQRKRIKRDEEYICSEYVARCYESVGLKVKWNRKGFVAPADFARDENFNLFAVLKKRP